MGAWIEIMSPQAALDSAMVAPLVGAWIEITACVALTICKALSLLSWERGLKYIDTVTNDDETSRSSRGSVD